MIDDYHLFIGYHQLFEPQPCIYQFIQVSSVKKLSLNASLQINYLQGTTRAVNGSSCFYPKRSKSSTGYHFLLAIASLSDLSFSDLSCSGISSTMIASLTSYTKFFTPSFCLQNAHCYVNS